MSNELRALLARVEESDAATAQELRRHIDALQSRRQFGLNFERHTPESVALTGRPISVGDKVRFLPLRGETAVESDATWIVTAVSGPKATRVASLVDPKTDEEATKRLDDLVFVADFRDPIYPGLKRSGEPVLRGGNKPSHAIINAENYHALEALMFTSQGQVDCIYIDPPYNTRDKDWRYNNDFVDPGDSYAHSKWLAFIERRLKLAKKLLNPQDSVLLITIDEKEYLRLGMLLEQVFPGARIQMVSVAINPSGQKRDGAFRRSDEYLFVVSFGRAEPTPLVLGPEWRGAKPTSTVKIRWDGFLRSGTGAQREDSPLKFYPIIISTSGDFLRIGDPLPASERREDYQETGPDEVAVWPIRKDGSEGRWQTNVTSARRLRESGFLRTGRFNGERTAISYLKAGEQAKLRQGVFGDHEIGDEGYVVVESESASGNRATPTTQWNLTSHSAADHGSSLLRAFIPGRRFPFPKSLYAVEDALRFFVVDKPDALIVDFFAGSGTTTHAVMRLNKQDGGQRRSISVTNNEVNDREDELLTAGLRAGDEDWEAQGICERITKPRIIAATTGQTPHGEPVEGRYLGTAEREVARQFKQVGFISDDSFAAVAKRKQLVALIDDLPMTLVSGGSPYIVSPDHTTSVLFDERYASKWIEALQGQSHIARFVICTPNQTTFRRIRDQVDSLLGPILKEVDEGEPRSDGFEENVEFFTLTYENPALVELDLAFERIAPLLWLRAGSKGRCIESRGETFEIVDTYAVLFDVDASTAFLLALEATDDLRLVYVVTDDETQYQAVAGQLPEGVESVRLYESYLRTFQINTGRA